LQGSGPFGLKASTELKLATLLLKHNTQVDLKPTTMGYATMIEWVQKQLTKEWKAYYLPEDKKDIETWLMEHTVEGCGGTVCFETEPQVCSLCNTPLPSKLVLAITMFIKKDLLKL